MMLSECLKLIRKKSYLSQQDFAQELSVAVSTVNRWETGKAKPNLTALKKIKEFCKQNNLDFDSVEAIWLSEI